MNYDDLPKCCRACLQLDFDGDEYSTYWYCDGGIFWPMRKQSCKKQKLRKPRPDPGKE